ncbi:MAG: hypothetical protein JSR37_06210 [Verrucomicrobia bacterium]|nr:hypothetical protein [Verrucomicrobiota bacterium]MBS0637573.1 hypothetical protein [Verrucomicrobiota bacterium]
MKLRFLSVLLGALIALQPAVGYAFIENAVIDKAALQKNALEMRANHASKHKALQKKRMARAMQGEACQNCATDGCCGCYVIRPCDFGLDRDTTYVISQPGKYTLQQDVVFFPADEFTPAILILSDNVTLDLCEHTLSQGNDTPNAYGVQIGQGYFYEDPDFVLKNIEVENGNIVDFTAIGVFCYNGSFDEPTAQVAFEDLRFHDLNILECGSSPSNDFASGIDLDSSADDTLYDLDLPVAYKNVIIADCNINSCLGNGAVNVYTGDDVVIRNTNANDLLNTETVYYTFAYYPTCRNLVMSNCQGNNVRQLDLSREQCGGLESQSCVNAYVSNCQFNDAFGEASVIVNSNTSNGINHVYENCQFNNARGGAEAGVVAGVHMSDGSGQETSGNGMKFINCQFNGTTGSAEATSKDPICGFLAITLKNIVFEDCQACNIHTDGLVNPVYGFLVATFPSDPAYPFGNNRNITFSNCVASDVRGNTDCAGIAVPVINDNHTGTQGEQLNMVIENCIVEHIYSPATQYRVAGIEESLFVRENGESQFPIMRNLYVRDCRVSDVHAGSGNPLSAGILVESVLNPVLENNSVSDCDVGVLFTGTNDIIPNAFQLAASFADATATPPLFIDIDAPVGLSQFESFENKTRHVTVQVLVPDDVDSRHDFLFPTNADLTAQGWESGDRVVYKTDGGLTIPGLVNGGTYYAIVYSPGFTKRGLVQNNNVTNCLVAGYKDDRCPTKSAWINNMALLNGTKPSHLANFAIKWPNKPQVDKGTLGEYPKHPNKNFNTSLIYAKKEHKHHSGKS